MISGLYRHSKVPLEQRCRETVIICSSHCVTVSLKVALSADQRVRQPAGDTVLAQDLHSPAAMPLVLKKLSTNKLGHLTGVRTGCLKAPAGRPVHNQVTARAASGVRRPCAWILC